MILPPYLSKGDTIGIVAPAGFMPVDKMQACVETLDAWGYNVQMGETTHSASATYFSGTDNERLDDLQEMLDNPYIHAVLCARGGYGTSRIIDDLNFKRFRKKPKWIIGFSDITVLHSHLYSNYKIASLHAPMAAAFTNGEENNVYIQSLKKALAGEASNYEAPGHSFNKPGVAEGELIGGNLSLLAHLTGTNSDSKTKNRILFLEDIGEYLYAIDRMLVQLKRSGKLKNLAGLIIGGFTEMKDTERPFGRTIEEIIYDQVKDYDYPVCFGFPVSHDKENYALKIGIQHSLQVSGDKTFLKEIR